MFCYPWQNPNPVASIRLLVDNPVKLAWMPIVLIYGIVLEGPWAVLIGELGWVVIRKASLPGDYSFRSLLIAGAIAGAAIGGCYQIITFAVNRWMLYVASPPYAWAGVWLAASVGAGAFGGALVAYYSLEKEESLPA
jgi:hypothetical protein